MIVASWGRTSSGFFSDKSSPRGRIYTVSASLEFNYVYERNLDARTYC